MTRIIGYARTSTTEQIAGLEAQVRDLNAAGANEIFDEQVSSVAERGKLDAALSACLPGDALMVTKPDRLARSTRQFLEIHDGLKARGIGLIVLSMGSGPVGENASAEAQLSMMAVFATLERKLMLERQKEGIAKAKSEGKYKGHAPSEHTEQVLRLYGTMTQKEIASQIGCLVRTVTRIVTRLRREGALPITDSGLAYAD